MAFVVIVGSIRETISYLHEQIEINAKLAKKLDDPNRPHYINQIDINRDKLDAAIRYSSLYDKKSSYEKNIKHLKFTDRKKYIEKCRQLTKGIVGVSFDKRDLRFVLRITRQGKKLYIGAFDTPQDALEVLEQYV